MKQKKIKRNNHMKVLIGWINGWTGIHMLRCCNENMSYGSNFRHFWLQEIQNFPKMQELITIPCLFLRVNSFGEMDEKLWKKIAVNGWRCNFWTTILNLRSYSLTLKTMPLFPWALLITGGMLLLTLPILSGALLMVLADLHSNTLLFDPIFGGDPIFYQHLFWFFGHPEVYILIIPAFGIISITISGILQKLIFGNQSMIFAMSCISLLGSVVWGHHMYTVGLETDTRAYFSGVTILISLPTGTKIFNWLSTYLGNPLLLQLKTNSPFFGLLFLLMFTIGGSTGIILGNAAVDLGLHDTYYVVTHFHFVLSLGAVIAIFSGVIFNGEKIVGSKNLLPSSSSCNSLYHLVSTFIGILLTFSPMHFLGFNVMPRRIPDFPDSFHSWNFLSSIGSGITVLSFAIFSYKLMDSYFLSFFYCFYSSLDFLYLLFSN